MVRFVENSLFTTLTNVNFDVETHISLLKESQQIKERMRQMAPANIQYPEFATYNLNSTKQQMLEDAKRAGIMFDKDLDEDIRSLRQTIIYGLKGISAYGH